MKMIFIATSFCFVFFSCFVESKKEDIRIIEPKEILSVPMSRSKGWLVFNSENYPQISSWKVEVKLKSSTNQSVPAKVYPIEEGKNFWKVPKEYLGGQGQYELKLVGINSTSNLNVQSTFIGDDLPIKTRCSGCSNFEASCSWECVGPDYAYRIQAYSRIPNGGEYYLGLEKTAKYDSDILDYIPYYYYVPEHNYVAGSADGYTIIGPIITSQSPGNFCSATGSHISGTVYGVAKDLGPWDGSYILTDYIVGDPPCADDVNAAIMLMNLPNNYPGYDPITNPDLPFSPALSCGSTTCGENGSSGGGVGVTNVCNGISLLSGLDYYDDLAFSLGCLVKDYDPNKEDWEERKLLSSIHMVEVRSLSGGKEVNRIGGKELVSKLYKVGVKEDLLYSGLNLIGVYLENGGYNYTFVERSLE